MSMKLCWMVVPEFPVLISIYVIIIAYKAYFEDLHYKLDQQLSVQRKKVNSQYFSIEK